MTPLLAHLRVRSAVGTPSRPRPRLVGRRAVLLFAGLMVALNFGFAVGLDHVFPTVRDPEYGRRLSRLKERQREHPGRPLVVVLGNSRTAMGVRPADANGDTGPLLFNFAQVGSGPLFQLMTLRRLLDDGVRPAGVVCEFWPPFLREDGPFAEEARIDTHRLRPQDLPFVRSYFADPDRTAAAMRRVRLNALSEYRVRSLNQLSPGWLPFEHRIDGTWLQLDPWGWLPGLPADPPPAERAARLKPGANYYTLLFAEYRIDEKAERATRELLTLCREQNIAVTFAWLPEGGEFRQLYPPAATAAAERFLAEFGVPCINARDWVADPHLGDGFHLTQPGAAVFSKRFGDELRARNFGGHP